MRVLPPFSSGSGVFAPTLHPFPEGNFVDLSALVEEDGHFTRIQAHDGWLAQGDPYKHSEFWHFSACLDDEQPFSKKKPFSYAPTATVHDMAELIGLSAQDLHNRGIAIEALERVTA